MKKWSSCLLLLLPIFLVVSRLSLAVNEDKSRDFFYAVESNGVVNGYGELKLALAAAKGRQFQRIEERLVIRQIALGMELETKIFQEYRVDPQNGQYFYMRSEIEQGGQKISRSIDIAGQRARVTSDPPGTSKEIALTPAVLRENPLFSLRLVKDFRGNERSQKEYQVLDALSGEVHRVTYAGRGKEKYIFADRSYEAIVLESLDHNTGLKATWWLHLSDGYILKIVLPNRQVYLTEASLASQARAVDISGLLFAPVDKVIPDFLALSYLKVEAVLEPRGNWITPESLNVPGQCFTGTVKDNVIEGTFEISWRRYDGSATPPFPPDFNAEAECKKFLQPGEQIESADQVLVSKAKEITAGAADSWQAAQRLCRWVAEEIGYDIAGGMSARQTFDRRLGECGAHSLLLAALCRAMGIPARVVWGCTYLPDQGGRFGQHAWNEVYMGQAGWIPLDSTAHESECVDAGHIRLGVLSSPGCHFNPQKMAILEFRYRENKFAKEQIPAGHEKYAPYLGEYTASFDTYVNEPFRILPGTAGLALAIPGKMTYELNDPDDLGLWFFKMTPLYSVYFLKDVTGKVTQMTLTIRISLPRKNLENTAAASIPDKFRPYVGLYQVPMENRVLGIFFQDDGLFLSDPEVGLARLQGPDERGRWRNPWNSDDMYFTGLETGQASALVIEMNHVLPRGRAAALLIEEVLQKSGIGEAEKTYRQLLSDNPQKLFFSEASFNVLGYKLLNQGKKAEAIAVFTWNIEAYPQSGNVYDSLAEAYMLNGVRELAISNYERSLALNPHNENARANLRKLRGQ